MSQQSHPSKPKEVLLRQIVLLLALIGTLLGLLLWILSLEQRSIAPVTEEPPQRQMLGIEETRPLSIGESGAEQTRLPRQSSGATAPQGRLIFIIDDAGYSLDAIDAFLRFPGKLTIAVLPSLPFSREIARRATDAGKEVILHAPMEALNGADPGPGAIQTSHADEEIRSLLDTAFESVGAARGANNHMGSRATADVRVMDAVMKYFHDHGKFFVDSRTTSGTVAVDAALRFGVPVIARDVFLDNDKGDKQQIMLGIEHGIEVARSRGHAVMIGHATSNTLSEVLSEMFSQFEEQGVETAFVSELVDKDMSPR